MYKVRIKLINKDHKYGIVFSTTEKFESILISGEENSINKDFTIDWSFKFPDHLYDLISNCVSSLGKDRVLITYNNN